MKYLFPLALICLFILNGFTTKNNKTETIVSNMIQAQDNNSAQIPYSQIPDYPETYTAANVTARAIDGLGYRFYWATEGLTDKVLDFDPGNDNRTPRQMMSHFVGLSVTILNTVKNQANIRPEKKVESTFAEQRKLTLENLKEASDLLRKMTDKDIENTKLIFQRGENKSEFPFWHLINGPITDAIYHTGQIVSQRRSAGNPISSKVNVFMGKNRE